MVDVPKVGAPKLPTWAEGNAANRKNLVQRAQIDLGLCKDNSDFDACGLEVGNSAHPAAKYLTGLFKLEGEIKEQEDTQKYICNSINTKKAPGEVLSPETVETCADVGVDLSK